MRPIKISLEVPYSIFRDFPPEKSKKPFPWIDIERAFQWKRLEKTRLIPNLELPWRMKLSATFNELLTGIPGFR
jgi:hypothetical protein